MLDGADRALHQRAGLACGAAVAAGLPGRFRVWEQDGLLAVLATDPALAFLSTVSGISAATVEAAVELAADSVWQGVRPVLVESPADNTVDDRLAAAGLVVVGERGLAVCRPAGIGDPDVVAADGELFVRVLLAGYQVGGAVAAFIAAEHRVASVRRFLLLDGGEPVAAAALSVHHGVAVLGGAATLLAHRGRGAQARLIRHRLSVAADLGCSLAVATAVPGSGSAANLRRAGFAFLVRQGWGRSSTATDCSARLPR